MYAQPGSPISTPVKKWCAWMVGRRDLAEVRRIRPENTERPIVLSVQGLSDGKRQSQDVSFELRRGEIVGLAGLVGRAAREVQHWWHLRRAAADGNGTIAIAMATPSTSRSRAMP